MSRKDLIKSRAALYEAEAPLQEPAPVAQVPGVDGIPRDDYYAELSRGPGDVILSGPLLGAVTAGGKRPRGRIFSSRSAALEWARERYGEDRVREISLDEEVLKWAVMVKNLRS